VAFGLPPDQLDTQRARRRLGFPPDTSQISETQRSSRAQFSVRIGQNHPIQALTILQLSNDPLARRPDGAMTLA